MPWVLPCRILEVVARSSPAGGARVRGRSDISLLDLLDLGLLRPGQKLQLVRQAGPAVNATVTDRGTIVCQGTEFRSLTMAAKAVKGFSVNGWEAWRIPQGNGTVNLDTLRQQARQQR
jgi:Restriction Enzyme Adenine Methylase Associated